ncbi:thiol-disulfide oxidoreductase DCC family protein [Jiella marina]|uniref:thiol-disulfide oxidoreductase DCC family protein n=1 Tax=Jiella sp. LLJ827 TaxID=2917712 RepID=UPI0021014BBA|nr:DCC1-like thiol-disulfide oxidoreductase family protein [Jiella sp. LLJ827]MCQ0986897.1 DCC1-like thiol-disulfide oxidoreductase family protein [Jiella sp. LLJ827]
MSGNPRAWPDDGIILYDGICILCSSGMRFVARRDAAGLFRFAPIQSAYGGRMAEALGIDPASPETFAVIIDGNTYFQSDATIAVLARLPRWRWAAALGWVPRPLRDRVYQWVARNRYRLFGKKQSCDLPPPNLAERILTEI